MRSELSPGSRWGIGVLLATLPLLAWSLRFGLDDAYISFRYAWNLVHGHGLNWNPGEPPIEGYSNPLWTLLMTVPIALGWDPLVFSQIFGVACFAGSLWCCLRLGALLFGSSRVGLWTVILVGTNFTFCAFATGGLETSCVVFLVLFHALLVVRFVRQGRRAAYWPLVLASLVGAAAILTRLDAILLVGFWGLALVVFIYREKKAAPKSWVRPLLAYLLPAVTVGILYAGWKLSYYGALLPNTFSVKVGSGASWRRGVLYVGLFWVLYGWILFLPLAALASWRERGRNPWIWLLWSTLVVWSLYVVRIGGDFMEFRFIVPMLPFGALLLVRGLEQIRSGWLGGACLASLVVLSGVHGWTFREHSTGIESVAGLEHHLREARCAEIGRTYRAHFGDTETPVTIASTAAGATAYYAQMRFVDIHGLNDAWVARHGIWRPYAQPGHQRVASVSYLVEQGVNLVVGPILPRNGAPSASEDLPLQIFGAIPTPDLVLPAPTRVIEIPLDADWAVATLYLVPHPAIEAAIREHGWNERALSAPPEPLSL